VTQTARAHTPGTRSCLAATDRCLERLSGPDCAGSWPSRPRLAQIIRQRSPFVVEMLRPTARHHRKRRSSRRTPFSGGDLAIKTTYGNISTTTGLDPHRGVGRRRCGRVWAPTPTSTTRLNGQSGTWPEQSSTSSCVHMRYATYERNLRALGGVENPRSTAWCRIWLPRTGRATTDGGVLGTLVLG
jgi:hypothetical protein